MGETSVIGSGHPGEGAGPAPSFGPWKAAEILGLVPEDIH